MILEILMIIQIVLLLLLIKAVKGPEIVYHRRKRFTIFAEKVKSHVTNLIERVRSIVR